MELTSLLVAWLVKLWTKQVRSWTLIAGNNINILSDEEEKTETISATYEVDDALSPTSTNPVENRVIYDALQNVEIDVDNALSTTSENPVQNKVITAAYFCIA